MNGERRDIYTFTHYDRTRAALYLFDFDRRVYRIRAGRVDVVDNGTDDVYFFRSPGWQPFTVQLPTANQERMDEILAGEYLAQQLFGGLRPDTSCLTAAEQGWLLVYWILAVFFRELFPTRPILALVGPAGSGKSTLLRQIGRLLFGSTFELMQLSPDPKDFDAAVTNLALVGLDNADVDVSWLPDRLAVVSTGGSLKRRQLYTTNKLVEYPVVAFLGITSRTPHYRREDVADRLLVFNLERFDTFEAEEALHRSFEERRNTIMTEIVRLLRHVMAALSKPEVKRPSGFRMADFAQFALRIAHGSGQESGEQMASMLDRLASEQRDFAIQHEPLFEVIGRWLDAGNKNRWITTAELWFELGEEALRTPPMSFPYKDARALGMAITDHWVTLRRLFAVEQQKGHAGTRRLKFDRAVLRGETGETLSLSVAATRNKQFGSNSF
jgi:hypothetical protein